MVPGLSAEQAAHEIWKDSIACQRGSGKRMEWACASAPLMARMSRRGGIRGCDNSFSCEVMQRPGTTIIICLTFRFKLQPSNLRRSAISHESQPCSQCRDARVAASDIRNDEAGPVCMDGSRIFRHQVCSRQDATLHTDRPDKTTTCLSVTQCGSHSRAL